MKRFVALLLAILCIFAVCSCKSQEKTGEPDNVPPTPGSGDVLESDGVKHIVVKVVDKENKEETFEIDTTSEMLRGALDELGIVEGDETQYGLFIKTVNGLTVDDGNEEWWCLTKGGESVMTGVDSTPIADGDQFELTFTVGY